MSEMGGMSGIVTSAGPPSSPPNTIQFSVLDRSVQRPIKSYSRSAGYDFFAPVDIVVEAGSRCIVDSKVSVVNWPSGTYGRLADRSSIAWHHGVFLMGGVIDPDYCGSIKVILFNTSSRTHFIPAGSKFVQLIIERFYDGEALGVGQPPPRERGTGEFGSSNVMM